MKNEPKKTSQKKKKRAPRIPVSMVHERMNCDAILNLYVAGLMDKQVAMACGVSDRTLRRYKQNEVFKSAVQHGKEKAVLSVENSLFKRACGYNFAEVTMEPVLVKRQVKGEQVTEMLVEEMRVTKTVVKQIAADPECIEFYLANRDPKNWKRKLDLTSGGEKIEPPTFVVPAFSGTVVRLPVQNNA
jgi:hypothetical protein